MSKLILKVADDICEEISTVFSGKSCKTIAKYPSELNFIQNNYIDLIRMIQDVNYLSPDYKGPLQDCNDNLNFIIPVHGISNDLDGDSYMDILDNSSVQKTINDTRNEICKYTATGERTKKSEEILEDIRDGMMDRISLALWAYDKQVFTFSDELLDEFIATGDDPDAGIPVQVFKNMPFKSICIDVSDNDIMDGNGDRIFLIIVSVFFIDDNLYYVSTVYKNGGIQKNNKGEDYQNVMYDFIVKKCPNISDHSKDAIINISSFKYNEYKMLSHRLSTILGINCLAYLASNKPDVEEDSIQKKIYRPSSSVKNKLREIRKWNVGFRYADSIKKQYIQEENGERARHGKSSSKRPHVRKAHWHRYWIGHGEDKHLELRWVSSCHINVEFISDLPVVSHKEA